MQPAWEPAELPADAIEVGRILDAWGLKGWLKVLPHSASPEALFSSKRWFLQPNERGASPFVGTVLLRIREAKEHSDSVVALAHDLTDRDVAESLKGARIFVQRSSFPSTNRLGAVPSQPRPRGQAHRAHDSLRQRLCRSGGFGG